MPSESFRIGVAGVSLSVNDSTALPSLVTLAVSASAVTPDDLLLNDVNQSLLTSTNYQVIVGLIGRDTTNGGYTVGYCSPGTGVLTVTSGQAILIKVANAAWPANYNKAICAAIFIKEGTSDFKLSEFAYIDTSVDFKHLVKARPITGVSEFTSTLLQSTTVDTVLGSRAPLGVTYRTLSPTIGGVTVTRDVASVTVSPDTSTDFTITTARTASIAFQLLPNAIKDVIAGNAGVYAAYTDGGLNIKEAQMSLNTAKALVTGNKPFKLVLPPDALGVSEVRLYLGLLTQNQQGNTETWSRDNTTPIGYNYSTASLDKLTQNVHTEIVYSVGT